MSKTGEGIWRSREITAYFKRCPVRVYVGRSGHRVWHIIGPENQSLCQKPTPDGAIHTKTLNPTERLCKTCVALADPEREARLSDRWGRSLGHMKD